MSKESVIKMNQETSFTMIKKHDFYITQTACECIQDQAKIKKQTHFALYKPQNIYDAAKIIG